MANPVFQSLSKSFGLPSSSASVWFGFKRVFGDGGEEYIFGARGTEGVFIADISDKSAPIQILAAKTQDTGGGDSSDTCRAFIPFGVPGTVGAKAFSITRSGAYDAPNARARIMEWDISDADPANWGASSPLVIFEDTSASPSSVMLYSDMETDGVSLFVAGQRHGFAKFNPADVSVGPVTNLTGDSENQGLDVGTVNVFFCNYVFGLRVLLKSTLADVGSVSIQSSDGFKIRPWDAVLSDDENFLFCSFNTSGGSNQAGVIVYDVSNPASIPDGTIYNIPVGQRPIWNGAGDEPCLRLSKSDHFLYVSTEQNCAGIWDISDPNALVFLNNQGNLDGGDTTAAVLVWQEGANYYAVYGDGYQPDNTGTNQFYIDQVFPRGIMAFTIGNPGSVSVTTRTISDTQGLSTDLTTGTYTAVTGDIVTEYQIRVQDSAGARDFDVALYDVSGSLPVNLIAGSIETISNPNTTGSVFRDLSISGLSIPLTGGVEYMVCVSLTLGASADITHDGGTGASRDNTVVAGAFNATWTNSQTAQDLSIAAIGESLVGPPSFDSDYADQQLNLGASVNIDVSTNWSSVITTSFTAIDLPPGLSMTTEGVITGNIAMGGVLDTTIKVVGANGSLGSAGFTWFVSI